jgi:hypothetical protein
MGGHGIRDHVLFAHELPARLAGQRGDPDAAQPARSHNCKRPVDDALVDGALNILHDESTVNMG